VSSMHACMVINYSKFGLGIACACENEWTGVKIDQLSASAVLLTFEWIALTSPTFIAMSEAFRHSPKQPFALQLVLGLFGRRL
jgi:hypothetical protein